MKQLITKLLLIAISIIVWTGIAEAQNPTILNRLKSKYSLTRYQPECGGWYLLGYSDRGVNYYGFADKEGNVIATNAVKYKIHKGFIELQIFDELKKDEHDIWLQDKKQYDRDMVAYEREEKRYEGELSAWNQRVAEAKREAENQWKAARQAAYDQAVREYRIRNPKKESSSVLGSILTGVGQAVLENSAGEAAAAQIAYKPYEDQILGMRGLTVKPYKAHNPKPECPKEPSDGYEWKTFPLLQPCPYTEINFSAIEDDNGVAVAKGKEGYGLVNSSLKPISSFKYSSVVPAGNKFKVYENDHVGLIDRNGKTVIPSVYSKIDYRNGCLFCKKDKLWGVYTENFEELYPCQYSDVKMTNVDGRPILYAQYKGLWGAYDFGSGQQLLPFSYGKIETSALGTETCFKVSRDKKMGLYTIKGLLILPCEYSDIKMVKVGDKNYIQVNKDGHVGLYDRETFPVILPDKYDSYEYIPGKGFMVKAMSRKGFVDLCGNEIVPAKYSFLENNPIVENTFYCMADGKCGILDMSGKELFPLQVGSRIFSHESNYKGTALHYVVIQKPDGKFSALDYDGQVMVPDAKDVTKLPGKVASYLKKNPGDAAYRRIKESISSEAARAEMKVGMDLAKRNTFSFFAQNYVEKAINDWQKKGEYEKMEDWKKRVNDETRQQKVFSLTKEAQEQFVLTRSKTLPQDKLVISGPYDPDNETFTLRSLYSPKKMLTVNISACDAEEFKTGFDKVKREPKFAIQDDFLGLSEYHFTMPNGNVYHYRHDDALNYAVADVQYNFDKIDLESSGKQGFSTSSLKIGTSDVDVKIPVTDIKQEKTFAIIIANEKYENEKNVDFAYNDGVIFKEYCIKTLGLPEINVHFVPNATLNQMRQQFNWIQKTAEDFKGEAKFIVYYAGHGMPDDETKEAYLLPSDADGTDPESAYKLSKVYETLGEIPSENVLMLMDACFSGSQRNGETLASARSVALRPKINQPRGPMTVFSAVTDKETAYAYHDKQHGLFTYFLLKKLKEHNGPLNLGELAEYVSNEVAQHSIVVNKKSQHPTVSASNQVGLGWRNIKLK